MTKYPIEDQFECTVNWQGKGDLLPGRSYILLAQNQRTSVTITKLKYKVSNSNQKEAANILHYGETGIVTLAVQGKLNLELEDQKVVNFVIIDEQTSNQLGTGTVNHRLRRATNIRWQALTIDKFARAGLKNQTPCVLWLTGFSGSGKSTIANLIEKKLFDLKKHSYLLDGDNIRHGLNKDLGFTDADRVENIRRVAETAKLMVDAGLIVLTSFISPFRSERQMARELMEDGEFIEVFIDTPLEVCEQRDPKGLYKKVRAGQIKNFTGFDSPYEAPEDPEIKIDTTAMSAEQAADAVLSFLQNRS